MSDYHTSVLLHETLDWLHVEAGKTYIDATLGGGGHTAAILERGGMILGIDHDLEALEFVRNKFKGQKSKIKIGEQLVLAKGNFKDIDSIARDNGFKKLSGIVFDLGVSSHQFDQAERGFSFQREGPLDMRMDLDQKVMAADLIHILTKGELYELFTKLGEEWLARPIITSIIRARQIKKIETTTELADIINKAVPHRQKGINPATKVFQALRIAVNDELNNLIEALPKARDLLGDRGRLAVITFHSLEDRIVKHQFRQWAEDGFGEVLTKKPVIPTEGEIEHNKRSRSAKLRVFERTL
jgi:16S rRNA (cytosine1402-N4)-methyltransferase